LWLLVLLYAAGGVEVAFAIGALLLPSSSSLLLLVL